MRMLNAVGRFHSVAKDSACFGESLSWKTTMRSICRMASTPPERRGMECTTTDILDLWIATHSLRACPRQTTVAYPAS